MEVGVRFLVILALCWTCTTGENIPIRLVGGSTPYEGRVEVFYNNTWGAICMISWTSIERVICRQLGYPYRSAVVVYDGFFGNEPSSPMVLDHLYCRGSESNIGSCHHDEQNIQRCWNRNQAGVICQPSVYPSWQVRLKDGKTSQYSTEGRVEVSTNGTWGTICDYKFDRTEAHAICRMLGFPSGSHYPMSNSFYGAGTGPMLITKLHCSSLSTTNLTQCWQLNASLATCPTAQVAGVVCNYTSIREDISLRLAGPSRYEGDVEIFANGKWSRLCSDNWDQNDATVVCRQLGLPFSRNSAVHKLSSVTVATVHAERTSVWSLNCYGYEHNIGNCSRSGPIGAFSCFGRYDTGVACYPETPEGTMEGTSQGTEEMMPTSVKEGSTGDVPVAVVILGSLLAFSLIIILVLVVVLVVFMWRNQSRKAVYIPDNKRGNPAEGGRAESNEMVYENSAYQAGLEDSAASLPAVQEDPHMYESLQKNPPHSQKKRAC